MTTATENAPQSPGRDSRGEDRNTNPYEGETINMKTTDIVSQGSDIHPEIPMPHWATDRYLDDEGRIVKDETDLTIGKFRLQLNRMHSITDAGYATSDDNVDIWWRSVWADGSGVDNECFTVLVPDIPELIASLQRAHEALTAAPRALRRSPEVDDRLRDLEN